MRQQGSLLGLILKITYQLHRHRLLGLPMDSLAILLMLVAALILWQGSEVVWAAALGGLTGMGLLVIWSAGRVDYLLFHPEDQGSPNPAQRRLEPDREIRVNATGPFAVHGQERYVVDQPAIYTTPRSREHIVMVQLTPTRVLLVGESEPDAWGWWYQFFRPEVIDSVEPGEAVHGWGIRPALRITYRVEDEKERQRAVETILSFEDRAHRSLVWADIMYEQRAADASQ